MEITKETVNNFWGHVVVVHFSNAKIKIKSKSLFMRFLGILLFFNPSFMKHFITVIGTTVYIPDNWIDNNPKSALIVLAHEFVHMWDRAHDYKLFSLRYLSPQIWAVFSLFAFLGFINLWFLCFLAFTVFLIPWSSPWRTTLEINGYAMTMFMHRLINDYQYNKEQEAEFIAKNYFAGSNYYWMCRNVHKVKNMLVNRYDLLPQTHDAFMIVHTWFTKFDD